ncbi:NgoMIV family type II restriction endonuclease [Mycolicibacter algericus]|uniref:Type II restriction endonuclease NgoMIV n=2 Tax=Mycolicibacter algericus TaxID=1288388 RepID=A0A7I9YGE5_MYCAL|nr:NgoMIV family type II restriction endonuclease [Mycolicibacter algericus]OQZ97052.1 restriction endonuclease [Mycolicibacter algericus DSM 45454]GFG87765.1 type II restriction endonuclease NgoMIV [Mycolicibacter algericus]
MIGEITKARNRFHASLVADYTLSMSPDGVASNADGSQKTSRAIAGYIAEQLGAQTQEKLKGQQAGTQFERAVKVFLDETFPHLQSVRPGAWTVINVGGKRRHGRKNVIKPGEFNSKNEDVNQISKYEPYTHLADLAMAIEENRNLEAVLGNSYEIGPDILVLRDPVADDEINRDKQGNSLSLVDDHTARHTIIRSANQPKQIIHALVSCKWTIRSDRAQNSRSEALNIMRNRKGRTPHIVVVTGEPTPSRLASLALGTGDLDIVYHFALPELVEGVKLSGNDEAITMLDILITGQRLRDITDLALDLAV